MSKQDFFLTDDAGPAARIYTSRTQVHVPFSCSITRTDDPRFDPVANLISVPDGSCKSMPRRRLPGQAKAVFRSENAIRNVREKEPCHAGIAVPHERVSDRKDP
ncbi:hypothetical protein [Roseibium sp.]|uniref:hypothetical protein n=1 Tax=Roseibium sp. TaxID=1936156 RepID=UPI003BA91CF7